MQELNEVEMEAVSGGMSGTTGAGLILGFAAFATAPAVVAFGVGAAIGCVLLSMTE